MLKNKKILLGITGGIAIYKAIDLASKLTKAGAVVKTIMTSHATEFISPIIVRAITHQSVNVKMFDPHSEIEHITLADWADISVIAPATANFLGKAANGIADDLLSTTILATTAPILFVPAMNVHMYDNPVLRSNLVKLQKFGYFLMEPEIGKLACGYKGKGRYPRNEDIIDHIRTFLRYKKDLVGNSFLITAGANQENIDPMRFISNRSSGKMGLALAKAASIRGAQVKLIYGKISETVPSYIVSEKKESAQEMHNAVITAAKNYKVITMAAAVADFTPSQIAKKKIKKANNLTLDLQRTTDILAELGKNKKQKLIGFSAETDNLVQNAQKKLQEKNLDLIIANNLNNAGKNTTTIKIINKNLKIMEYSGEKFAVAHKILDEVKKLL